ncbi:unnamed protein product [Phaedon cochleariae]|uniref:Sulfatase N-terminal domain-containing protein n=1 Tax=Phaedon cochleariae TaxID=80249 RepID=A0A9N9SD56_PHACE|nr:unnamed protein product [Phaedon cochleariae]
MKDLVLFVFLQIAILNCAGTLRKKPNIVIILADDVGWNDFGIHGSSQIRTPNIDALGFNGVVLDKFYTQQTCTPSRAALLTGNYPIRSGLQGIPLDAGENRSLPLDMPTMPERLKGLGYRTHLVGKWHLGAACKEVTPTRRGFDTHFGYWNGYVGYFSYDISVAINTTMNFTGFDLHNGFEPQWPLKGRYATELFTRKAVEVIDRHDRKEPLFLMLAHLAGHAGQDGVELGVPNTTAAYEKYRYIATPERRLYADIVNIMDNSVGEIVTKLSERRMLDDTIILFFSDNGAQTTGMFQNFGSGWPFRGLKFTLNEGGVRGTGVLYSSMLQKKGYINNELIHITDLLPTFYHAAGGNVAKLGKIDGINQWNVISKNETTKRTELLINIDEVNGYSGILGYEGRYKLLNGSFRNGLYNDYYGDSGRGPENPPYDIQSVLDSPTNTAIRKLAKNTPLDRTRVQSMRSALDRGWCAPRAATPLYTCDDYCLFDIRADPCETENLIGDDTKRDVIDTLKGKLRGYYEQLVPETNKKVDPDSDPARFNNTWYPWLECTPDEGHFGAAIIRRVKTIIWEFFFTPLTYQS